jgi:hypothetical protein
MAFTMAGFLGDRRETGACIAAICPGMPGENDQHGFFRRRQPGHINHLLGEGITHDSPPLSVSR